MPIAVDWLRNERALGIAKEGGGIEDLTLCRIDAINARDASNMGYYVDVAELTMAQARRC
jgi:hypothetical protein